MNSPHCHISFQGITSLKYHIDNRVCDNKKTVEFETINDFINFKNSNYINFKQLHGSKTTKNGHQIIFYCTNFNKNASLATHRAPSLKKFYETNMSKCNGKLTTTYLNDSSVKLKITPCTNIFHLNRRTLGDNERNFILNNLRIGMETIQIRAEFLKKYKKYVSRYEINNLKYANHISMEYRTNRNDIISTRNLLDLLEKEHSVFSNIYSVVNMEDIIIILQFSHQKAMAKNFTGILCIDSTHGVSKYLD